jgi:5'-3' exonuclease
MILCCDSAYSWRKESFVHYKAHRAKVKKESKIDWKLVYEAMDSTLKDFKENFPFRVMEVPRTEADDIIGVLALDANEPSVIVSKDHDFLQLLGTGNVAVYNPYTKKLIKHGEHTQEQAEITRLTHIISGDTGDGVPNIWSDDDTFVDPTKRQKSCFAKVLTDLLSKTEEEILDTLAPDVKKNFIRNKLMVDLREVPVEYKTQILEKFHNEKISQLSCSKLMTYFIREKMKFLGSCLSDFSTPKNLTSFLS